MNLVIKRQLGYKMASLPCRRSRHRILYLTRKLAGGPAGSCIVHVSADSSASFWQHVFFTHFPKSDLTIIILWGVRYLILKGVHEWLVFKNALFHYFLKPFRWAYLVFILIRKLPYDVSFLKNFESWKSTAQKWKYAELPYVRRVIF